MKRLSIWIILIVVWFANAGFAPGAVQVYSEAVKFAKAGKQDFAFMHYNKLLRNYPRSKYREEALFATGEYYFRSSGLAKAKTAFTTLLEEYPNSEQKIYVLAYLLHIAHKDKNDAVVQDLEKKIVDFQRVSFVFREKKEIAYRSPLYQKYKTIIHIDKIEFYVEGKLFAKVSY